MAIATVEDLTTYLRTQGAAGTSASLPGTLLELLLGASCSRIVEAVPERTLEATGTDAEPVELRFATIAPQRVVQVPDLRELRSATFTHRGSSSSTAIDVTRIALRRRPLERCALWASLPYSLGDGELALSGLWGPAGAKVSTPDAELDVRADVREAALVWAARVFHNRAARFADNTAGPDGVMAGYFRNLPADVKVVLESLEVPGV